MKSIRELVNGSYEIAAVGVQNDRCVIQVDNMDHPDVLSIMIIIPISEMERYNLEIGTIID